MSAAHEYAAQPDDVDFEARVNDLLEEVRNGGIITMAHGHVGQEAIRRMRRQIELAKATTAPESSEREQAFRDIVGPEIALDVSSREIIAPEDGSPFSQSKWTIFRDSPQQQTEQDFLGGLSMTYHRYDPSSYSTGSMIREFREAFGQEHPAEPTLVPVEESSEMLNWIVFGTYDPETGDKTDPSEFEELLLALADNNLAGIADAIGDTVYLWYQFAARHGIDLDAVLREIHRSNMSKLGADGKPVYYPNSTKVAKGPNYSKPDIAGVLGLTQEGEDE